MHTAPPLLIMDYVGPAVGAVVFVFAMSFAREPTRRTFNAILGAGAGGVYLSGGGFARGLFPLHPIGRGTTVARPSAAKLVRRGPSSPATKR